MKGYLYLEDGTLYTGNSFGYAGVCGGEVIFNTGMSGYQEILTDPSYEGQIVTMTYPMIGNYGVNTDDVESRKIFVSGFVVREYVSTYSNWRATQSLHSYLQDQNIVAIEGIDTRALTRKLRTQGSMRAVIAADVLSMDDLKTKIKAVPSMTGLNLASKVATEKSYTWDATTQNDSATHPLSVVVIDCGVKFSQLRRLKDLGAYVTVVPPTSSRDDILKFAPKGILISNGPGDPDAVTGLPNLVRSLVGTIPIFGICLGHQILALAVGAKTYKLKFGHHGLNHPVRDERTGKIEITSQNHGFAVDGESLLSAGHKEFGKVQVTHVHLSDGTLEGFKLPEAKAWGVQYHPEAAPGPHDSAYLFEEFLRCIKQHSN